MRLNLAGTIASNMAVDEADVLNTKRALNRLGVYTPDPRVGLHEFPDGRLFTAIKTVQQAHDLIVDGKIGLNSATLALINTLLGQAENKGSYVWKTVEDNRVRKKHAARHGETFDWKDDPTPGSEPHCRCWAENVREESKDAIPILNKADERIKAILKNKPAIFKIDKNPLSKSTEPMYASPLLGWIAVRTYSDVIERHAKESGVDPNLVKAIMWAENARGAQAGLGYVADAIGKSRTVLPMNINPDLWHKLIFNKPNDLYNASDNIRASTILIRRIQDRITEPTPEKVGAIWQYIGREFTNDYAAYIQRIFEEKPWLSKP